jgi:hypothetical protein
LTNKQYGNATQNSNCTICHRNAYGFCSTAVGA